MHTSSKMKQNHQITHQIPMMQVIYTIKGTTIKMAAPFVVSII